MFARHVFCCKVEFAMSRAIYVHKSSVRSFSFICFLSLFIYLSEYCYFRIHIWVVIIFLRWMSTYLTQFSFTWAAGKTGRVRIKLGISRLPLDASSFFNFLSFFFYFPSCQMNLFTCCQTNLLSFPQHRLVFFILLSTPPHFSQIFK